MRSTLKATLFLPFSLIFCMHGFSQSTCGSLCTNPGFESGTGFWEFYTGTACQSPTSEPCNMVTGVNPAQHTLQTSGGFDPVVGGNILPVVPPGGGTNSMRIGDGNVSGAKASRVSISYTVTQATANFVYKYAVVLQEPQGGGNPHLDAQRPYFSINVYDENGNAIPCGDLFVLAKSPFTNFTQTSTNSKIYYRGWTTATIALASHIGRCVRIEFTATDCTLNEHFGYAYIDASCDAVDMIISSSNECGGYTLTGPANALDYDWTNITVGGTTGIDGPNNTRTINVTLPGTYQVEMSSPLGPSCSTRLNIAVDTGFVNPVSFTPNTGCSSITTQFTDTSTPGGPITAWDWDFNNDGITDDTRKNPTYNFPGGGIYPVTLKITVGSCTASLTQNVSVSLPALPTVEPAGPFCLNSSPVNLNVNMTGGTWSGNGITNIVTGAFDPSLANVGNNSIAYTTPASCPGSDTIIIVINAPLSDAGPNSTLCTGSTGNIGSPSIAGNTYSWSPTTGLSSSTISNPTVTLINNGSTPQSIVYYVTTTVASTGCYSSDSVVVTINSLPLVNAGSNQTICSGSSVTLSGSIAGSATGYTWSGGSGTYNPNNATLNCIYTPSANEGNITLMLTTNDPAGPCPSANDQMSITINPSPSVNSGPNQTICVGQSVSLTGSFGGTATSASWSGGTGTYTPNNTTPNATYTPNASEIAAGFVTLTLSANDPTGLCGSASKQMSIYINPLPSAYAGQDRALCNGATVQLAGATTGTGVTATWSGGAGTYNPDNKTLNAIYTPTAQELTAGITLNLTTDPMGSCPTSTDQVVFTISPIANVSAGTDQIICVDNMITTGNTVTLGGAFSGSATSGLWTGGAGSFTPGNTTPNATYTLNESELSSANITLTFNTNDPVGPCPAVSDQMVINISQTPKVNAGGDQTICSGSTVTLGGTVSGSASTVTWSGGAGAFSPNNTSINCIYTPTASEVAAGSVLLTLTTNDPIGPCVAASDQMQVFINQQSSVSAGPDQTVCVGDVITLAGTFGGAASSGTWSGGTGTYTPDNTTPNATYTPSLAETTNGSFILTFTTDDPTGPCSGVNDQVIVNINQMPTANAGITQPVCYGSTVQLGGSVGGSANSGTWSGGTGTFSPNNTTLNALYTPSISEYNAGSVTLTLTSNSPGNLCLPASSQVTLSFYPPPSVNFSVDAPAGCAVHCATFTDDSNGLGGSNLMSWNWDFGDGGSSNLKSPMHCYSQTGDFGVTLKVTDNKGCSTTLTQDTLITVYDFPVAAFSATPNPISELDPTVTFNNLSSRDVNYWYWDFGDGDTLAPDTPNPIHRYSGQMDSEYQPILIVRNANLCSDTASIGNKIRVGPTFSFFIPNAFTPDNSSGVNDYFFGTGTGIDQYDMWIYDRFGNMIFHGKDINDKWDGKANKDGDMDTLFIPGGKRVAQRDLFVWKVILTDVFGNIHNYTGTVTLVR